MKKFSVSIISARIAATFSWTSGVACTPHSQQSTTTTIMYACVSVSIYLFGICLDCSSSAQQRTRSWPNLRADERLRTKQIATHILPNACSIGIAICTCQISPCHHTTHFTTHLLISSSRVHKTKDMSTPPGTFSNSFRNPSRSRKAISRVGCDQWRTNSLLSG